MTRIESSADVGPTVEPVETTLPAEPAGIYNDAGPHAGRLIPALARFWTHVLCALFVPLLVGVLAVGTSEVLGCIGGLTVGRSPESGFWYACVQPVPTAIAEPPPLPMEWFDGSTVLSIAEDGKEIAAFGGSAALEVYGEGQLMLGKTDVYPDDVECNKDNEGALLYFKKSRMVRVCNGYVWVKL